jgi:hypothetical protein
MIEVKQIYDIEYTKGEYKHCLSMIADSYEHALAKFKEAFKDATVTKIEFGGPICL